MQTAAISYRVADFLKGHPPFQSMEEADLLGLASRGRVKFHESEEYILWQGTPHGAYFFVIQQGTVSLWDESGESAKLRDIRGVGDMLGIDRFFGAVTNTYSSKTNSDVIVYAFQASDFEPLLAKYPQASQYVASHASVSTDYQPPEKRRLAHRVFLHDAVRPGEPLMCRPLDSIRDAARRMHEAGTQAVAVVDAGQQVIGVVTATAVLCWIAVPGSDPDTPVERIMSRQPRTIGPEIMVSQCVLEMAETDSNVLVTTGDGTPTGKLHRLVTAADVETVFGGQPLSILREIANAPDLGVLRTLQAGLRAFLLDQLLTPSTLDWLAKFAHRADAGIIRRIVQLAPPPNDDFCLCVFGAAGRRESLTSIAPSVAVIIESGDCREAAASWHQDLIARVAECGYLPDETSVEGPLCDDLDGWKERFRGWVGNPVLNNINDARPLFDLRPIHGRVELWRQLETCVREGVRAESSFVRIMAHDCMGNLPPLTIFRDLVVQGTGEHTAVFQLERKALRPLVDVARVLGIGVGIALGGTSLERFELARTRLPDQEAVFREAADTLRVVLFHQARSGIRSRTNGFELQPGLLSGHDRQVLKSGFRSILRLLEFTAECCWLGAL